MRILYAYLIHHKTETLNILFFCAVGFKAQLFIEGARSTVTTQNPQRDRGPELPSCVSQNPMTQRFPMALAPSRGVYVDRNQLTRGGAICILITGRATNAPGNRITGLIESDSNGTWTRLRQRLLPHGRALLDAQARQKLCWHVIGIRSTPSRHMNFSKLGSIFKCGETYRHSAKFRHFLLAIFHAIRLTFGRLTFQ